MTGPETSNGQGPQPPRNGEREFYPFDNPFARNDLLLQVADRFRASVPNWPALHQISARRRLDLQPSVARQAFAQTHLHEVLNQAASEHPRDINLRPMGGRAESTNYIFRTLPDGSVLVTDRASKQTKFIYPAVAVVDGLPVLFQTNTKAASPQNAGHKEVTRMRNLDRYIEPLQEYFREEHRIEQIGHVTVTVSDGSPPPAEDQDIAVVDQLYTYRGGNLAPVSASSEEFYQQAEDFVNRRLADPALRIFEETGARLGTNDNVNLLRERIETVDIDWNAVQADLESDPQVRVHGQVRGAIAESIIDQVVSAFADEYPDMVDAHPIPNGKTTDTYRFSVDSRGNVLVTEGDKGRNFEEIDRVIRVKDRADGKARTVILEVKTSDPSTRNYTRELGEAAKMRKIARKAAAMREAFGDDDPEISFVIVTPKKDQEQSLPQGSNIQQLLAGGGMIFELPLDAQEISERARYYEEQGSVHVEEPNGRNSTLQISQPEVTAVVDSSAVDVREGEAETGAFEVARRSGERAPQSGNVFVAGTGGDVRPVDEYTEQDKDHSTDDGRGRE